MLSEPIAAHPAFPTTPAIAPNAPIGASHMIPARILNTSRCSTVTAFSTGCPLAPRACTANPTSNATNRASSTDPDVNADTRVVGMMSSRKFPEVSTSGTVYVAVDAAVLSASPGVIRFPTSNPRNRANVDITMKYNRARPPTLPTWDALRTEPMPNTMVQKMIGPIIILIRFTNAVPITARPAASLPKMRPTAVPATTATMTATYSQWVLIFLRLVGTESRLPGSVGVGDFVV